MDKSQRYWMLGVLAALVMVFGSLFVSGKQLAYVVLAIVIFGYANILCISLISPDSRLAQLYTGVEATRLWTLGKKLFAGMIAAYLMFEAIGYLVTGDFLFMFIDVGLAYVAWHFLAHWGNK